MTRADDWADIAEEAISTFPLLDEGSEEAHTYAYIAGAIARRDSWFRADVAVYLNKVFSLRKPDGGWGLNEAWDAFQNNTTNPATTSYTITMADHVGPVLLDAYLNSQIPGTDVQDLVDLLMSTHTTSYTTAGRCIAYSRSGFDNAGGTGSVGCVHNVNAAAAWFLLKAHEHGFTAPGLMARVADLTRMEASSWKYQTQWWPYKGDISTGPADVDHTGAEVEFMWPLCYPEAYMTGLKILTQPQTDNAMAPIGRMRVMGLHPDFYPLGDAFLTEAADFVASPPTVRGLAQAAYWASRNADVMA